MEIVPDSNGSERPSIDAQIIVAFSRIYQGSLKQRDLAQERGRETLELALPEHMSHEYCKALYTIVNYETQAGATTPELVTALNAMFIWKIGQILMINPLPARSQNFRQLISPQFDAQKLTLPEKAVLSSASEFCLEIESIYPSNDPLREIFNTFKALLLRQPTNAYLAPGAASKQAGNERTYLESLVVLKAKFLAVDEKLQDLLRTSEGTLSMHDIEIANLTSKLLKIVSGQEDVIIDQFGTDSLIVLCAYLSFVDPSLKKEQFKNFSENLIRKNKLRGCFKEEEVFILEAFAACDSPHEFINRIGPKLPPWFIFHFGDMLVLGDSQLAKREVQLDQRSLTYPQLLTIKYLEYLSQREVDFGVYRVIFDRFYTLSDKAPFEFIIPYAVNNYSDIGLLSALKKNNCGWLFEYIAEKILEKYPGLKHRLRDPIIQILFYMEDAEVAGRLQDCLFEQLGQNGRNPDWARSALQLCQFLKQKESDSNTYFEEVALVLATNYKSISQGLTRNKLLSQVTSDLNSLARHSRQFVMAEMFILAREMPAAPVDASDANLADCALNLLFEYQTAKARPADSSTDLPIDHKYLEGALISPVG